MSGHTVIGVRHRILTFGGTSFSQNQKLLQNELVCDTWIHESVPRKSIGHPPIRTERDDRQLIILNTGWC